MSVAQVAHDMREYIEEHGWIQGQEMDHITGAMCLVGALGRICNSASLVYAPDKKIAFRRAFYQLTGENIVARWNDAPGRTYEDVILLLKQIEAQES